MLCASSDGSGVVSVLPAASQPADLSTCAIVLVTGAETGALSNIAFPSATDGATAWTWGFSVVVVCYLFGVAAGAVVNFLNKV